MMTVQALKGPKSNILSAKLPGDPNGPGEQTSEEASRFAVLAGIAGAVDIAAPTVDARGTHTQGRAKLHLLADLADASITMTAVSVDDFNVGDEIEDGTTGARGVITSITGVSPTYTFNYTRITPDLVFSSGASTITNNTATGSATKDANPPTGTSFDLSVWVKHKMSGKWAKLLEKAPGVSFGTAGVLAVDDSGGVDWHILEIDGAEFVAIEIANGLGTIGNGSIWLGTVGGFGAADR